MKIQYEPWEKHSVQNLIENSNKKLQVLDIQLGGNCNLRCIYCDTPKYGYPCLVDLNYIEELLDDGDIKWIYVCGLGEPTDITNINHLKQLLKLCKEKNIKLSMFSNIINLDKELIDYIDNETLCILFKLDTFDKNKMKYLYGKTEWLNTILKNYQALNEVVHYKNGITNLGASIVPTSINYSEIDNIVEYCLKNNIFPFIGQLENAGCCSKKYSELMIKEEDLLKLKNHLKNEYNIDYEMPLCPATISGLHITNANKVILDERTGLSCPWFWLDDPKIKVIGDIKNMNYNKIVTEIFNYRKQKMQDVIEMEKNIDLYPFGGCGGNCKKLLKTYIEINKK